MKILKKILKLIAAAVLFVVVSGLLLFTLSGFGNKTPDQPIPESVRNLPIKKIRGASVKLQDAALIDGFPIAAGWVHFKSGQLSLFRLGEDAVIQDNLIPQNTWVRLDEEGNLKLCFLPKDTEIQGHLCDGGWGGTEGVSTAFYPSGRLRAFYPPSNVTIQGIPCSKNLFIGGISLYENGNLQNCTLSREAEIDGQRILKGSAIALSEDGEVTIVADSWKRRAVLRVSGIFGN